MGEGRQAVMVPLRQELGATHWLERVQREFVIAVIRAESLSLSLQLARVAIAAGLRQIEITSTSAQFTRAIAQLRETYPDCTIGTGTVVQATVAKDAISAGAQFIFAPYYCHDVMVVARDHNIAMVPGALTPTEIGTAWREGATAVKVFPIQSMGGPSYLKALAGPMGDIPLIPTGGITCQTAASYMQAGAIAVGLSTDLFPKHLVAQNNWNRIEQRIEQWHTALLKSGA